MEEWEGWRGLELIRAGIDVLLKADHDAPGSTEHRAFTAELEAERRRMDALDEVVVAKLDQRGVAGECGHSSTAGLLVELLRIDPGEAKARVARARDMGPRTAFTGEPLEPILPLVAQAQRSGEISAAHATVITKAVDAIPRHLAADFDALLEQLLVGLAVRLTPREVAQEAVRLLARIDQDGAEPREREQQERRSADLHTLADGTGILTARLTPAAAALWTTIVESLAAPLPAEDGTPDPRSAAQRRHDALLEAGQRLIRSGTLPHAGGAPVTLLIHMSEEQFRTRAGYAETAQGDLIGVDAALRDADEADILTVVETTSGDIVRHGRSQRCASVLQRRLLAARDRGCSFPGCHRPPGWCQAHHIRPWLAGGPTDLDNLTLVCEYHHRNFEKLGWEVRLTGGPGGGIPEWLPPAWLDPDRQPRRNRAHHHPEYTFAA